MSSAETTRETLDVTAPPGSGAPWFAVTMTVRNNADTIARSIGSILPQLDPGGELSVVDGGSTDGTFEALEALAREHPAIHADRRPSNRGLGRNLAVRAARAPIVLTHVDGDNVYAGRVLREVAGALRAREDLDVLMAIGDGDRDPSSSRFYAWRRAPFERIGGYVETQYMEDLGTLIRAFRAGLRIQRVLVPRVAEDLKPRDRREAPNVGPWGRSNHVYRAARKFRIVGFRYGEYLRFLALTRRSSARYLAGVAIGSYAYLVGALRHNSLGFLRDEDSDAEGVRAYAMARLEAEHRPE